MGGKKKKLNNFCRHDRSEINSAAVMTGVPEEELRAGREDDGGVGDPFGQIQQKSEPP